MENHWLVVNPNSNFFFEILQHKLICKFSSRMQGTGTYTIVANVLQLELYRVGIFTQPKLCFGRKM
jgi:hypothetical protein